MDTRFMYTVAPRRPIRNLIKGRIIVRPENLLLTKEDVLLCIKHGPVYRKFHLDTNLERVTPSNLDRLHREIHFTEEQYKKYRLNHLGVEGDESKIPDKTEEVDDTASSSLGENNTDSEVEETISESEVVEEETVETIEEENTDSETEEVIEEDLKKEEEEQLPTDNNSSIGENVGNDEVEGETVTPKPSRNSNNRKSSKKGNNRKNNTSA